MKKIMTAFIFAVATTTASADQFAEVANVGGGKIVLLTAACETKPQMSRAFFYTKEGITEDGCWKFDAETIIVEWQQQGRRRYPIGEFRLLNQFAKFKIW